MVSCFDRSQVHPSACMACPVDPVESRVSQRGGYRYAGSTSQNSAIKTTSSVSHFFLNQCNYYINRIESLNPYILKLCLLLTNIDGHCGASTMESIQNASPVSVIPMVQHAGSSDEDQDSVAPERGSIMNSSFIKHASACPNTGYIKHNEPLAFCFVLSPECRILRR